MDLWVDDGRAGCFIEVKNVSAAVDSGIACFPDAVRPADAIDSRYGRTLRAAIAHGVEVVALGATPTPRGIHLERRLPVVCPALTSP